MGANGKPTHIPYACVAFAIRKMPFLGDGWKHLIRAARIPSLLCTCGLQTQRFSGINLPAGVLPGCSGPGSVFLLPLLLQVLHGGPPKAELCPQAHSIPAPSTASPFLWNYPSRRRTEDALKISPAGTSQMAAKHSLELERLRSH